MSTAEDKTMANGKKKATEKGTTVVIGEVVETKGVADDKDKTITYIQRANG